jgi:Putative prokaryotic signal transducing protein
MTDLELREVAERYQQMSESELMDVARKYDELTEPAKAILRDEFARRSLQPPLIEEDGETVVESRKLVTVGKYRDLPEAFVARSVLESAGIQCFLQDENTVRLYWLWSNLISGASLQVAEEDAAAAAEVLAQPIPASFATDSGVDFEQPVCPQCGSLDVVVNDPDRKINATTILLIGAPLHAGRSPQSDANTVWKCLSCGCLWQTDGEPDPDASTPVN